MGLDTLHWSSSAYIHNKHVLKKQQANTIISYHEQGTNSEHQGEAAEARDANQPRHSIRKPRYQYFTRYWEKFNACFKSLETKQNVSLFEKRFDKIAEALNFRSKVLEDLQRKELPKLEKKIQEEKLEREKKIDTMATSFGRENNVL